MVTLYVISNGTITYKVCMRNGVARISEKDADGFFLTRRMFRYSRCLEGTQIDDEVYGLLFQLDTDEYLYVGDVAYQFTSVSKIESFDTYTGGNGVSYPVAVDTKSNQYLLAERVRMWYPTPDPYEYFYKHDVVVPKRRWLTQKKDYFSHNGNEISHVYVNGYLDTLFFTSQPDRYLTSVNNRIHMFFFNGNNINLDLPKLKYIMDLHGKKYGFIGMKVVSV
jgi:hypothetical protein